MVNTINELTERNKELLNKIEELESKQKTEISREAQLKIIEGIEKWKKENWETGDRLKKYQGNTYPSHITENTTDEWPLWKQLAGHVNFELNMVQYLHKKEEPLNELLEMMLNSITRNVVGYYNWQGQRNKELENNKKLEEKYTKKIIRLLEETFPYDKLEGKPSQLNRFGISHCYLDTVNGIDYSDYIINSYKEKKEEFDKEIQELKTELKENEVLIKELEEMLKMEEDNADTHFKAIKACEDWYTKHPGCLKEKLEESVELLERTDNNLKIQEAENREMRRLLEESEREKLEILKKHSEEIEKHENHERDLQKQLDLTTKPLPKTPSKFKILKGKTKTKFQNLIGKVKHQSQELIAKIEIAVK